MLTMMIALQLIMSGLGRMLYIVETEEEKKYFRMCQLKARLKLELVGLKSRGKTAYSLIKKEYGFKGNRESVLEQLKTKIEEIQDDTRTKTTRLS